MAYLCTQGTKEQQIVTARGWENLSDCLYGYEEKRYPVSYRLVYQFIKSENVASQFYQYYNLRGSCLTARDIFQILNGADSKEYAFCLEDSSFDEKWRTVGLVKSCLSEKCMKNGDTIFQLDVLCTLSEVMTSVQKKWSNKFDCPNFHMCLSSYLGYNTMMLNKNVLFDPMEDDRLATVIMDRDPRILETLREELDELVPVKSAFGCNYCTNETMMDLVEEKIKELKEKADIEAEENSQMITNAIRFVEKMSEGAGGLLSGFINMVGKDREILRVLSVCKNPEYVKALKITGSEAA